MTRLDDAIQELKTIFRAVCVHETLKNYNLRNRAIIDALAVAQRCGYPCGIKIDPKKPEWPVVFFEIEGRQMSWYIPQYNGEWDGHDTEEKYRRLNKFLNKD